jgi:dynein heavy chain 1
MEYETFERSMNAAADVFLTWDENMKEFTNVAREGQVQRHGQCKCR